MCVSNEGELKQVVQVKENMLKKINIETELSITAFEIPIHRNTRNLHNKVFFFHFLYNTLVSGCGE